MASNVGFESSVHKASDLLHDYCCSFCEENDVNKEAQFYCEKCSKFYCNDCVKHHNQLLKKHSVVGTQDMTKWPVATATDDILEECQEHKDEKLKLFCEDHSQVLCTVCHIYNHQKCSHVALIADKLKALQKEVDFIQISTNLKKLREKVNQEIQKKVGNIHSVQKSYQKILDETATLRKKMNDALDQLDKNTKQELDTLLASLKTSLQTDIETCSSIHEKIKHLQNEVQNLEKKSPTKVFILYRIILDQSSVTETMLQKLATSTEVTLSFNPDTTIEQTLSGVTRLGKVTSSKIQSKCSTKQQVQSENVSTDTIQGQSDDEHRGSIAKESSLLSDPNQFVRVTSVVKYNVKMKHDQNDCFISGICETATGALVITDRGNNKVKLLSQTYAVVAHCDLPARPWAICSTDANQVAVAVLDSDPLKNNFNNIFKISTIHFIRVTNGQLVRDRTLKLEHDCLSVAHHQGKLYITSGIALYQYNVDGSQGSKIYEDTLHIRTAVASCAVSPDGERIYVTNDTTQQLLTLSKDGRVLSTLTYYDLNMYTFLDKPALYNPYTSVPTGLHVTGSGQVLVCVDLNSKIIQVDRDGTKKLAEVVTHEDGVSSPMYVSTKTSTLIVGNSRNKYILVFKTDSF